MFRENYASRLSMLKYSRKPYEVQDQRTRQDKDELSRLNMFLKKEKTSIKPNERQGFSFLSTYSAMALISVRMSPA